MTKQRRHERVDWGAPVNVRCGTWADFLALYVENIGYGGVYIRHDDPPEVGTELELHFWLPHRRSLVLAGKVAHTVDAAAAEELQHAPGFGVEFADVTADKIKDLAELISIAKRHEAAPPPPVPTR